MKIATYLLFNGTCKAAFELYKSTFNAQELEFALFTPEMTRNTDLVGQVFHAELQIEDFYLYLCDTDEPVQCKNTALKVTVETNSLENAEHYFASLSNGGEIISTLKKQTWGAHMGELKDRFGIVWVIVYC